MASRFRLHLQPSCSSTSDRIADLARCERQCNNRWLPGDAEIVAGGNKLPFLTSGWGCSRGDQGCPVRGGGGMKRDFIGGETFDDVGRQTGEDSG